MDQQTLEDILKQGTTKPIYKPYLPFLKLARDCFAQNPIITYWTLCYVLETALKNHSKPSDDFRKFLSHLMVCLEKEKKARTGDSLFVGEAAAKTFIEEYGNKLVEKAEENEELLDRPDLAYKLYLTASTVFQMYDVFAHGNEENAKRVKFCKWRAVECFKKKKEQEENPQPPAPPSEPEEENNEPEQSTSTMDDKPPACQPGDPVCPYPNFGSNNNFPSFPSVSDDAAPKPEPVMPTNDKEEVESKTEIDPPAKPAEDYQDKLNKSLAALKLSKNDSHRAELLCESALYAIKSNDLLTAVETLKQTLDLLYKSARK